MSTPWLAYAVAGIAIVASFAVRLALTPLIGMGAIFLVYEPAIALIALLLGRSPAFAAIALSSALGMAQIVFHHHSTLSPENYFQAFLHISSGLIIVFIADNWRSVYSGLQDAFRSNRTLLGEVQASEAALRQQSSQLALALEAGQLGTWQYDLESNDLSGSEAFWNSVGLAGSDRNLRGLKNVVAADDFKNFLTTLRRQETGRPIDTDLQIRWPHGGHRLLALRGQVKESAGRRIYAGVSVDVTQRRQAAQAAAISAQDKILIEELVHRIKNLFPVILAIVRLTARHSDSVADYQEALIKRLRVLEAIQSLLAQGVNRTASIEQLVLLELRPFKDDSRLSCSGCGAVLMEGAAESFSMMVHELTTNSVKYGALSHPYGKLQVRWDVRADELNGALVFEWIETGSVPRQQHRQAGYGSSIIGASGLPLVGDSANLEFTPDGIHYTLTIPYGKYFVEPAARRLPRRIDPQPLATSAAPVRPSLH